MRLNRNNEVEVMKKKTHLNQQKEYKMEERKI